MPCIPCGMKAELCNWIGVNVKNFILMLMVVCFVSPVHAVINNLDISTVAAYKAKANIPSEIIGTSGHTIPDGIPLIIMKTKPGTYGHWTFVAYGESMNQMLSIWLTAKSTGNTVSCVNLDRGNYWVECAGTWIE